MVEKFILLYETFSWLTAFGVMISYIVIDGLYAKYTLEVVALKPFKSASIGAGMHFLLAYGVINYTENWLYIFPLVLGSWLGTYLVVRKEIENKIGSKK